MRLNSPISLILFILNISLIINAQVGIGTSTPTGILDLSSNNYGLVLPKGNINDVENPQGGEIAEGTLFYDKDSSCLKYFGIQKTGEKEWSECITTGKVSNIKVYCNSSGFKGAFIKGIDVSATNGRFSVLIENNSFSEIELAFQPSDLTLSGVPGIYVDGVSSSTINLKPGQSQNVIYNLKGIPDSLNELKADWNKLTLSCVKTQTILNDGAEFSLNQNISFTSFIYKDKTIQGILDNGTNKVNISIPYSNGTGSYSAYEKTIKTAYGTSNDLNDITVSYPEGDFVPNGSIPITITIGGTDSSYKIPMQAPGEQSIFASIPIEVNSHSIGNINLNATGGIKDRSFGDGVHDFVYFPITGDDGRTWLNNNLGAHYSNLNSITFDPTKQATSVDDINSYGNYIQKGRPADGHEIHFDKNGTFIGSSRTTPFNTLIPNSTDYVTVSGLYTTVDINIWKTEMSGVNGKTNPCPAQYGYRLPTKKEIEDYLKILGITESNSSSNRSNKWFNSSLKIPSAGLFIPTDTAVLFRGSGVYFHLDQGYHINDGYQFDPGTISHGQTIRCIKDENY